MKNTFFICFFPKYGKEYSNGEIPIFCRITIKGERAEITAHVNMKKEKWEFLQENLNTRKGEFVTAIDTMDSLRLNIKKKYNGMVSNSETMTAADLKLKVLGISEKQKHLIEVADYFYKIKKAMVGKTIDIE